MAERTCERCSASYTPKRRDQRTCSAVCRRQLNNAESNAGRRPAPSVRTCPVCGVRFSNRRRDAVTCSPTCARRHCYEPRDRWHDKTCVVCKGPFRSKRSDAIYCGHPCWMRANYDSAVATSRAQAWSAANRESVRAIKLRYKIKRRDVVLASPGVSNRDWLRLLNRHDHHCAYCGDKPVQIHMDHVVPLMRGGRHSIGNVLPACPPCNLGKNARLLAAWKRGR